jgi:hypothetical protein
MRHFLKFIHGNWSNYTCSCGKRRDDFQGLICSLASISRTFSSVSTILFIQTQHFSQMADVTSDNRWCHARLYRCNTVSIRVDRRSTEMKFTTEQLVFIVKSFARKKLTENVSVSFVVNILTSQFPQRHVYPDLWKSGRLQVRCVTWRSNRRAMSTWRPQLFAAVLISVLCRIVRVL